MGCNAKYVHSNLAIRSLYAYTGSYDGALGLYECTINQNKDEILKDIYRCAPQILCVSCYIWNLSFMEELLADLNTLLPDTVIWAGGPEVTYDAEAFLQRNREITGVMVGEGEEIFACLMQHYLRQTKPLEEIRGITYRTAQGIRNNPPMPPISLDDIPFVYQPSDVRAHKMLYYEVSRGCPFSCSYCLSSVEAGVRFRDLALVKKELSFFLEQKAEQIKFVDRTFNCNPKYAASVWEFICAHDNCVTNFHFEVAADLLTEREIAILQRMRPGLVQLEIGVQSTNPQTIEAIRRKMDFAQVSKVVTALAAAHNIHQHLDLIAGLPYEGYESFQRSFNEVYALQPSQLQMGFLKVLKGSAMHSQAQQFRCHYKHREPYEVLATRWLTYDEILRLKQVESMLEIYYNSGQFSASLRVLLPDFASPFAFYEALGEFYEARGYASISHSRLRRYEILLEFAGDRQLPQEPLTEAMTIDLYARERLKSRPAWMQDNSRFWPQVREYLSRNGYPKATHVEEMSQGQAVLFDYRTRDPLTHNVYIEEISL